MAASMLHLLVNSCNFALKYYIYIITSYEFDVKWSISNAYCITWFPDDVCSLRADEMKFKVTSLLKEKI